MADRISYGWDGIIDRAHECETPEYELIARELARPNRFRRRCLAEAFYDAHKKTHTSNMPQLRRLLESEGVTYCFLFHDEQGLRELRKATLEKMCFVARGMYPNNKKVIGIATEKHINPYCSYDFMLIDIPELTTELQAEMTKIRNECELFVDVTETHFHADEFPNDKKSN
jgi:hypothetical protein